MKLGVDIGGTFTDLAAYDPTTGELSISKALNSGVGPAEGVRGAVKAAGLTADDVTELTHGTTVVTNLLIERSGAVVGVLCTRGFRDVLEIQLSWRRRTFDLHYDKTPPLVPRERRIEIGGRIDRQGREQEPLDEAETEAAVRALLQLGVDSLAVTLYNAYANAAHERRVEEIVRRVAPSLPVTISTDVDPLIGEYARGSTAVLNAMAVPRMRAYVSELGSTIAAPIRYLHSAGGVVPPAEAAARPIQLALSGPAAGVVAARDVAATLDRSRIITLDMGGTSCDVCLVWDGELRSRDTVDIDWGVFARLRAVDIHTVGAGGGSIAWRDTGGALRVGPRSAGALPGPACYGRGGDQPTVTDANLRLGLVSGAGLLGGRLPLDPAAADRALGRLAESLDAGIDELALGVHAIVNANMAQAIREVTVRQGIDPRECTLMAFGGAGAQHACGVARELDIATVVVPANGGVLSAIGLLTAEPRASASRSVLRPVAYLDRTEVAVALREAEHDALARLGDTSGAEVVTTRSAGLRYASQSHEIPIPLGGSTEAVVEAFETAHERLFGTRLGDPVEIADVRVEVCAAGGTPRWRPAAADGVETRPDGVRESLLLGGVVPVIARAALVDERDGPCLVEEPNSVTVVPAGATVAPQNSQLVIELAS